jgi:hypothetical protein
VGPRAMWGCECGAAGNMGLRAWGRGRGADGNAPSCFLLMMRAWGIRGWRGAAWEHYSQILLPADRGTASVGLVFPPSPLDATSRILEASVCPNSPCFFNGLQRTSRALARVAVAFRSQYRDRKIQIDDTSSPHFSASRVEASTPHRLSPPLRAAFQPC